MYTIHILLRNILHRDIQFLPCKFRMHSLIPIRELFNRDCCQKEWKHTTVTALVSGISAIFSQLIFKVCFHFSEILFLYRPFYHSCCTICLQSFEAHFTIFCLVFFTKQLFCPRLVDRDSYGHLQHLPSHIQRARMELIIYLTSLAFKITQWGIPRK